MCGIFGVLSPERIVPENALLSSVARTLAHRGPDSFGVFADPGVGLVHTRLSLLDLDARSNQPFWDRTGRYALVYNGEIYNYQEIRRELEVHGVEFRTTGDTEVLLEALLRQHPTSILPRLEGMFAFGLYDRVAQTLLLGRDRFGIKPLYFAEWQGRFLFASEVKAFAEFYSLEPDLVSILSYVGGAGGPIREHTFFKGVRRLPPGHFMEVARGKCSEIQPFFRTEDFWDPGYAAELSVMSTQKLVDRAEEMLVASVKKHLLADAPVGTLASGGVDSSLITAIAARTHTNIALFHANVAGPSSEYDDAVALSRHLKLDLEAVEVHQVDSIDTIAEVMAHYEYPFYYHMNSIPFLRVAQLVRSNGVKAILSGEGSDECYLGYQALADIHPLMRYRKTPNIIRSWIRKIPKLRVILPPENEDQALLANLAGRFEIPLEKEAVRSRLAACGGGRHIGQAESLELLQYHLRTLLHRNDCLGMAASVEARFPFLDHDSVRMAVNMPYTAKLRLGLSGDRAHPFIRDKWIIREIARRYLPRPLADKAKRGFPFSGLFSLNIAQSHFADSPIADMFELSPRTFEALVADLPHAAQVRLLLLDVWARVCLQRSGTKPPSADLSGCVVGAD